MLTAFRAFAKSPWAAGLIVLLIASFAVFGIRDVFNGKISNAVIQAGKHSISAADFKREFDNYKARFEQQAGQPIPTEVAVQNGLDKRVLDSVATRAALGEMMHKMGIRPSDALVSKELQKIPAFFDPVSGRFDKTQFQQRLAENGLTPDRFVGLIGEDLAEQHLMRGLVGGLQMPRAYSAMAAVFMTQTRDVAMFNLPPSAVPAPAAPTDAQLVAFMKENAAQLTRPEFRVLTVVRFSPTLVGANLPVDEAELKKRYDFRKDTLSQPETRTIVQIPAKDQAAATQIAQRLSAGENPAAVAKAAGVEPVLYENKPQTAVTDKRVAAAAFRMPVNQVAPVQGDLGVAVVKVLAITPGKTVSFEQARPALEAELRKDAAAEKVYALSQAYDEAHQAGSDLPAAAQKAGVPAMTVGPVAKQGVDQQGRPVAGLNQKMVETAFDLPAGGESEVTEAGNGEYFAVRVDKIIPASLPPLEEVKPRLTQVWMFREMAKRLQAKADELAARVRKGEALDAVAASAGQKVVRMAGVDRRGGGQMGQELIGPVFATKPGETFVARGPGGFIVGKVEAVHAGEGPTLARMSEAARGQMNQALVGEMAQAAANAARQKVKVKIDAAKARAALGLEPEEPAPAAAAGKAGLAK
jgi:peptidyl-prolyl cis-trans isomerase D